METHSDEEISEANARNLPATILALRVVDGRTYELMANGRALLKKAWQFFEDRARPRISEAHEHWKNLLADLKEDHEEIDKALVYANQQLSFYEAEQERVAKLKQAELDAENKRKTDEEKLQLAELAEKAGDHNLAAEILDAPNEAPPVFVAKDVPKVEGLSFRDDWKFEIIHPDLIPHEYWLIDESKLGKVVRALKETSNIPGIRVYSVKVPVGRA